MGIFFGMFFSNAVSTWIFERILEGRNHIRKNQDFYKMTTFTNQHEFYKLRCSFDLSIDIIRMTIGSEGRHFYRYTKDGLAYLFKDFKEMTLFPNRGRIPTGLHILMGSLWKRFFERKILSLLLNRITSNLSNTTQTSGYYFSAKN